MKRYFIFYLFFFISFFILSCSSDDDDVIPSDLNEDILLSSEFLGSLTSLQTALIINSVTQNIQYPIMNVEVYKLTYKTQYPNQSEDVVASGLVIMPSNAGDYAVISYQHGTISNPNDAPSNYNLNSESALAGASLASLGFILSIPDYLGYGSNAHYDHPYEHANSLAYASYDMLVATKVFLNNKKQNDNEKLFLMGYSEGGTATLALHKYIETQTETSITATTSGNGSYNKTLFAQQISELDIASSFIPNYLWVIYSYNWIYNINQPLSYYINEPYASNINETNIITLDANLINNNPQELFTPSFLETLNQGDGPLSNALADNDLIDWSPRAPVRLYYGTNDDFVFPSNSITAYESLTGRGGNVSLFPINGANHFNSFIPYISGSIDWIMSLR